MSCSRERAGELLFLYYWRVPPGSCSPVRSPLDGELYLFENSSWTLYGVRELPDRAAVQRIARRAVR